MNENSRPALRRRAAAVLVLLAFPALAAGGPANAGNEGVAFDWTETYAGVFAGLGRADNRIVDVDGFTDWGNPGAAADYRGGGLVGGALVGGKFAVAGLPLRIEIDGTIGDLSASENGLDPTEYAEPLPPRGTDEPVDTKYRWVAAARVGIERAVGPATVFVAGGAAAARIVNSLTDLDRGVDRSVDPPRPTPWRPDPDDSFRDDDTTFGWTIGAGVETALADGWTLRLEGSYLDFGRSEHYLSRSGDVPCGPDGPRRACSYAIDNDLVVARLAVVRRFGR